MRGELAGVDGADAGDPERVQHAMERLVPGAIYRRHEVLRRPALKPLQLLELFDREAVEVGQCTHQVLVVEAVDELLAVSLDVHRPARDEVLQRLHYLARTVLAVGTAGPDLSLRLHGQCRTPGISPAARTVVPCRCGAG